LKEEMLTALPLVTKNTNRLQQIKELLDEESQNAIELIEEQAKLIDRMINNDGYQTYALQIEILKYF